MANKKKYYSYQHSMENRVKNAFDMAGKQIVKDSIGSYLTAFIITIFLIGLVSLIMAFPTMWLWNWIMPAICGFGKLSVWKALGLNFLCGILFKSVSNSKS
jgi:small-conductance mechanosensitive channel